MIPFRPNIATKEIVFVRHAESQANRDGYWNGRTDGSLSDQGEASLEPLGVRLSEQEFDRVVSSPLERTRLTAASFADEVEINDEFIEIDMGEWEGHLFSEIQADHGDELRKAIDSRTIPMGRTGESLAEVAHRALSAVDQLFHELEDGQRAAVVTHGGFLQSVLHRHMAGYGRRAHAFTQNTAITKIIWQFGSPRLAGFNDVSHLGPRSQLVQGYVDAGTPVFALVRHGRTQANVEGRWQGQGDWDLDDLGRQQAAALADWYGQWTTVYSSPLKRAMTTASHVASNGVVRVDDLKELNMGKWEGMTTPEIIERWPGMMETIYRDGVDLRRGETGESWGELTHRFSNAVRGLDMAVSQPTVIVAHGGAIRAYISSLTKTDDSHAESLYTPANTSVTHVAMTDGCPEILDYSVAPHLESLR